MFVHFVIVYCYQGIKQWIIFNSEYHKQPRSHTVCEVLADLTTVPAEPSVNIIHVHLFDEESCGAAGYHHLRVTFSAQTTVKILFYAAAGHRTH